MSIKVLIQSSVRKAVTIISASGNFNLRGGPFFKPVHKEISNEKGISPTWYCFAWIPFSALKSVISKLLDLGFTGFMRISNLVSENASLIALKNVL